MYKKLVFIFPFLIFLFSCQNEGYNQVQAEHPTPLNVSDDSETTDVLRITDSLSESNKLQDSLFNFSDQLYTIGKYDSNFDRLLSMIDDVEVNSSGEMYVLDSRQFTVLHFDSTGAYKGTIGRQGHGPGEFTNPESIMIYDDRLLFVSDVTKIEVFDISSEPSYKQTFNLDSGVISLCAIENTLFTFSNSFLHLQRSNDKKVHLIHAYNIDTFEHLYSFGDTYQSIHPDIIQRLSAGYLVCNETSNTVSFLFQFVPMMHAYDAESGDLKWSIRFDNLYLPKVRTELDEGRIRFNYSVHDDINDFFFNPITIKDQYILLQVRRSFKEGNLEDYYASFLIDSNKGTGVLSSVNTPHIMSTSNSYVAIRDIYSADYPTAILHSIYR